MGHNTSKASKNICCTKGYGGVVHRVVMRWLKRFRLACKNFYNQERSGWPKVVDSVVVPQARKVNPVSSTRKVSDEFSNFQSSVVRELQDSEKSTQKCRIVSHVTKILQNFWLSFVLTSGLCFLYRRSLWVRSEISADLRNHEKYVYVYIYIYMCVCVCVCAYLLPLKKETQSNGAVE